MKPLAPSNLVAILAVIVMLAAPDFAVAAVSIGEAVLQSKPGEPLLARVELLGDDGGQVDDTCLTLQAPDPLKDDIGNFLSEASLAVKNEGARRYVEISSSKPYHEAPISLRLQVKCSGTSGVVKNLVIPRAERMGEGVATLLARQKLLEDELSSVQQKLRSLQEESNVIKLRLVQLTAASSVSVSPPAVAFSAPSGEPENLSGAAAVNKSAKERAGNPFLRAALIVASALLSALILWWSLHYYTRGKLHAVARLRQKTEPVSGAVANAGAMTVTPLVIKHPSQIKSSSAFAAAPLKASVDKAVMSPVSQPGKAEGGEADSLLEEAMLYVASGRQAKAVEILQDIIRRYPSKAEAWTLLLSVNSSLGKVAAFESTARDFLRYHKASPAWGGIQALGRTLDRDNPLYAEHAHSPSSVPDKHQPIGDVLIEMGALSKRELQDYLDDFDPKKNGRFGGYLVARKAISIAQLDHALLQQQGLNTVENPAQLPSLQDIEQFLSDFDPKQHGSVSEYMALHNAASAAQLGRLLQQPSAQEVTVDSGDANGQASLGGRPVP